MACVPDQTLGWGWSDGLGEQSGAGILGACILIAGSAADILMTELMGRAPVGLGFSTCLMHDALCSQHSG